METVYYLLNPWWENRPFAAGIARYSYTVPLTEAQSRRQVEMRPPRPVHRHPAEHGMAALAGPFAARH